MAAAALDLDAYFARIGYTGPRAATPPVLAAIHRLHIQAIPFENLDVLLGRGIRIDLASVEQKLVHARRGGYCFEHNTLFSAVLRALGFEVTTLAARVRWNVPADAALPRTHMTLLVAAGPDRWLADVGFGGVACTTPLQFDTEEPQGPAHGRRRLTAGNGRILHQAWRGEAWADVYEFTAEPHTAADYEMANWFTSTHPSSRFRQNLVVARAGTDRHHTLLNRELNVRHHDGTTTKRLLTDPEELLAVLRDPFGLEFPAGTRFGSGAVPWPV